MRQLASDDLERRSNASLSAEVLGWMDVVERAQAGLVRAVGSWDEAKAWKDDGALSAASWLADRDRNDAARAIGSCRLRGTRGAMSALRRHSKLATCHRRTWRSWRSPRTSATRSSATTKTRCSTSLRQCRPTSSRSRCASGATAPTSGCWTPAASTPRRAATSEVHRLGKLVKIDGMLETDDWATVRAALDPLAKPDASRSVLSPRNAGRRLADALVELAAQSCGARVVVGGCGQTATW